LLEPDEQRLLRRLAAFRGSFSLAGAEAVCADDTLGDSDVLHLLGLLVDRSLVQVVDHGDAPRYRLLATVRQYAAAKLEASSESETVHRQHAGYFYACVQEAQPGLEGGDQVRALERLDLDHDNLIDALEWHVTHEPPAAVRFA
jgi:predicted ATPase